jgi:DNA-binding transcriptional MerR regulator
MVTTEPEVVDTGRYSAGETAKALGIHRNTLIAHTDKGTIKCAVRKSTGRKFYAGADIKKFWRSAY